MLYYFAPMEGLTGPIFRAVHHAFFPGVDRYFTPFLSPTQIHSLTSRDLREVLPGAGDAAPVVPQLLGKNAEDLLWAAGEMKERGFEEVNLNFGCPSATVVSKGKGSALLGEPRRLDELLAALYADPPLPLSVKTRLGLKDPEEFPALLEIYEKYPIRELTIHARTREEQYRGRAHRDAFARAYAAAALPLCYNGDVRSAEDCAALEAEFPRLHAVMIGRGLVANPALVREAKGGEKLSMEELRAFHNALFDAYTEAYGAHNAMHRMKEVWICLRTRFSEGEYITGKIARAKDADSLRFWAEKAFTELRLTD